MIMVVRLRYLPWLFKLFFFPDIHGPSRMNPNETLYWSLNFSSSATMKLTFVVYFPIQTLLFPFSLKHALSMTWHFVITGCMHPERGWRSTFKHYLDEEHFCSLTHRFLPVMINNKDNSHDVLCWEAPLRTHYILYILHINQDLCLLWTRTDRIY